MKKSISSLAAFLLITASSMAVSAQPTGLQPNGVSGSAPRPQGVSGSAPRPQGFLGGVYQAILSFFGV